MTTANWTAIRQEYERGDSLRVLAARHGVPTTTLHRKSQKEQWNKPAEQQHGTVEQPLPLTPDALSIAHAVLRSLKEAIGRKDLELKDIKMLSDSLSACQKVIIAAGPQRPDTSGPNFNDFDQQELDEYLFHENALRRIEQSVEVRRDEKITPLRRAQ